MTVWFMYEFCYGPEDVSAWQWKSRFEPSLLCSISQVNTVPKLLNTTTHSKLPYHTYTQQAADWLIPPCPYHEPAAIQHSSFIITRSIVVAFSHSATDFRTFGFSEFRVSQLLWPVVMLTVRSSCVYIVMLN